MITKAEIDEARKDVDAELYKVNTEISTRVAQRKRLEEERQRLAELTNDFLADELAALQRNNGL